MPGGVGGTGGANGAAGQAGGGQGGQDCDPSGTGGIAGGGTGLPGECGPGGVGQYPGETPAERQARLEGELEKSVGGFDEVLAEEQREVSTVGRDTEGFGGGAGGRGGSGGVGLGKQEGMRGTGQGSGSPGGQTGAGGAGSTPSVAGMTEDEIRARTPEDIPVLVSEDIVAKQLREAALAEDDPELRERLWDEYRRYNKL